MFGNYLKMAWKVLRRRRFFTFVSLFGIGFTLTTLLILVAIADHHLAPSYPEDKLDRMLVLDRMQMRGDRSVWSSSAGYKFIETYARELPGVERMSVLSRSNEVISFNEGRKLTFQSRRTDAEYWRIMDFVFLEGAPFSAEDNRNANRVAVISDSARRRFFGDDPGLGKTIELDGNDFRVCGVVKDVPYFRLNAAAEIWMPLLTETTAGFRDALIGGFNVIYLVESGVPFKTVQDAFRERLNRVEFPDPERYHTMAGLPMTRLEAISSMVLDRDPGEPAPRRLILFSILAVLAFMALPAINLVNINLSRIYERSGEIGVRKAFGAASRDLVTQFVVENVVLCLLGGVIGLIGAFLILQVAAHLPQTPFMTFQLNWRIFVAGLFLATVFGLLSGVWPAWKMSRQHPVDALKGGIS
jgi:putative ABC transport system permease protein